LNVEALKKHQEKAGTLLGFAGAERELDAAHAMELLSTECDIIVPAALEKQVRLVFLPRYCLSDSHARMHIHLPDQLAQRWQRAGEDHR
jgi:hypothetical protein